MRTTTTLAVLGVAAGLALVPGLLMQSGAFERGTASDAQPRRGRGLNAFAPRDDATDLPVPAVASAESAPASHPASSARSTSALRRHETPPPSAADDSSADPVEASAARNLLADEAYDDARAAALTCLNRHPDNRSCWDTVLMSYTRTGHFEEARPMLADCLEHAPDDISCIGGMVTQLVRDHDLGQARLLALRLATLAPDSTDAFLSLAQVEDASGSHERALDLYRAACSKGQEYACKRASLLTEP